MNPSSFDFGIHYLAQKQRRNDNDMIPIIAGSYMKRMMCQGVHPNLAVFAENICFTHQEYVVYSFHVQAIYKPPPHILHLFDKGREQTRRRRNVENVGSRKRYLKGTILLIPLQKV